MMDSLNKSLCILAITAILAAACATKAPAPIEAPAAAQPAAEPAVAEPEVAEPVAAEAAVPEKIAKQRTVVTKVPVLVKEASFYSDGLADEFIVYRLDEANKNVVEKSSFDPSRPEPILRQVSEYKGGRLTAESVYESDGKLRSRRELAYDSSGRLAMDRTLDEKGKLQSGSSYSYDAAGRKVEWRALDATGAAKAMIAYAYGPEGLVGVEMKDAGGTTTGSMKLEYEGGKPAKRSYFGPEGALQKYEVYEYEGELLAAVEFRRADGSLQSKTAYAYGPLGELAKAVEFDANGAAGAYSTYEYLVREDSSIETYYE